MLKDYVKYLTYSEGDSDWGLVCTVAGYTNINKGETYPKLNHPMDYMFNWEKGRVIFEYQLLYIVKGEGLFESNETGTIKVKQGSVILLFPDVWHRYKPNFETGWEEHYIGFKGKIVDQWVKKKLFVPSHPIFQIGINHDIETFFQMTFSSVKDEKAGYQQAVSGLIMALITQISAISKNINVGGSAIDAIIANSKLLMQKKLKEEINIAQLAIEMGVGYSWFRKTFKEYTGISPLQYILQLRIQASKILLVSSNLLIKEIAYELGFESAFYFSRIFKLKCGITAEEYRKKSRGNKNTNK